MNAARLIRRACRARQLCHPTAAVNLTTTRSASSGSKIPAHPTWSVSELVSRGDPFPSPAAGTEAEVDAETVRRLARLSHLPLTEPEVVELQAELESILGFVRAVQDVDTVGVEPLHSLLESEGMGLRDDVAGSRGSTADIMSNAPESLEHYFVAPKERHFEGGGDDERR